MILQLCRIDDKIKKLAFAADTFYQEIYKGKFYDYRYSLQITASAYSWLLFEQERHIYKGRESEALHFCH
jgi:hypothetical protein